MDQRRGDWMETYSGHKFWPLDPRPHEVHPVDVAHHLSMICRYNGACRFHFSVAQHSVLLSDWVRLNTEALEADHRARVALVHDASEAYFGDVVRPTKHEPSIKAVLGQLERDIEWATYIRFEMPHEAAHGKPHWMKDLEVRMALDERAALMRNGEANDWEFTRWARPLGVLIEPWSQERAKGEFRARLGRLFPAEVLERGREPT